MTTAEVAHILFLDIVGYSKELTTTQSKLIAELTNLVEKSPAYEEAKANQLVTPLSTGDGLLLVFFQDLTYPIKVAEFLLKNKDKIQAPIRMGIHCSKADGYCWPTQFFR